MDYFNSKYDDNSITPKYMCSSVYHMLDKKKRDFPSPILTSKEIFYKPMLIASAAILFFIDKITKLKETPRDISNDPISELRRFLSKHQIHPEGFSFKQLSQS